MRKAWLSVMALVVLLVLVTQSVLAAPPNTGNAQGGEGVHFGSYELDSGESAVGDLVVFGGPVVLRDRSEFDGDLTVFGSMTLESDAVVDGQLVVMGTAELAGRVHGDVFTAGDVTLEDTAYIDGDLSVTGRIDQSTESVVTGDVQSIDEDDWDFPAPIPFIEPEVVRPQRTAGTPRWVTFLWNVVRSVVSVVLLGLLALLIASLWPAQADRAGRAIEEAPLTSYGVGLLALLLGTMIAVLLAVTICLSPFALVVVVIMALGMLLGWVALGLILGRRILVGLLNTSTPSPVASAVVGTVLVTSILALSQVLGPLHALLLFLLAPLAAGAVVLTRFGTRPYATRGVSGPIAPPVAPPPSGGLAPRSPFDDSDAHAGPEVGVVESEPPVRAYPAAPEETGVVTVEDAPEDRIVAEDEVRPGPDPEDTTKDEAAG